MEIAVRCDGLDAFSMLVMINENLNGQPQNWDNILEK